MQNMRKVSSLVFLVMLCGFGIAQANDKHDALSPKIFSAKTIFVDNQTNDAELQHDAYMGLSRWGRYEIVDSPQKADLVLRLFGSSTVKFVPGGDAPATYNPKPVSAKSGGEELAPPGYTRLLLIEPKSGNPLWSDLRKTTNGAEKSRLLNGLHDAVDQQAQSRGR